MSACFFCWDHRDCDRDVACAGFCVLGCSSFFCVGVLVVCPHCLLWLCGGADRYTSKNCSDVHVARSTDSADVLAPSCNWMPHVRLIFLERDFVSCVDKFFCTGATVVVANVFPRGYLGTTSLSPMFFSCFSQFRNKLRKLLCASKGSMRSADHQGNTTTDLQSCCQLQVHQQVADLLRVARSSVRHLRQSHHLLQRLRCFCSLVRSDQGFFPHFQQVIVFCVPGKPLVPTDPLVLLCLSVPLPLSFLPFPLLPVFLPLPDR